MRRYFVHLDRTNAPKNALQRGAAELLEERDGLIINNSFEFTEDLRIAIEALNGAHPKCSPLKVSDWVHGKGWGISLGDQFTVGFYLYEIKEAAA